MPFGGLVRLPNAPDKLCDAIIYQGSTMLLYDLHKARGQRENMLTVVLRGEGGRLFGVLADIAPMGNVFGAMTSMRASVLMTPGGDRGPMLTLLAVDKIAALLKQVG